MATVKDVADCVGALNRGGRSGAGGGAGGAACAGADQLRKCRVDCNPHVLRTI